MWDVKDQRPKGLQGGAWRGMVGRGLEWDAVRIWGGVKGIRLIRHGDGAGLQ